MHLSDRSWEEHRELKLVAMAPVKVFGPLLSPNVTRVILCLEEVGVEYEIVNVDFNTGEHKSPQHLQRNVRVQAPLYITVLAFFFGFDVFVARFHMICERCSLFNRLVIHSLHSKIISIF